MIALNGIPRSGNHALQKACALLGVFLHVEHTAFIEKAPGRSYLYITREPRGMVCAAARAPYPHHAPTPEALIEQINNYRHIAPLASLLDDRVKWMQDADTQTISYEELTQSPAGFDKLASILEVKTTGEEFAQLPGGTLTWTGQTGQWFDYWSDEVEYAWQASGCATFEARI